MELKQGFGASRNETPTRELIVIGSKRFAKVASFRAQKFRFFLRQSWRIPLMPISDDPTDASQAILPPLRQSVHPIRPKKFKFFSNSSLKILTHH